MQDNGLASTANQQASVTNISRLLVIVAMDVEEAAILKRLPPAQAVTINQELGLEAKVFSTNSREIILVKSGIGLVNAGVTAALVAHRYPYQAILVLGVAGSLSPALEIGDKVIASHIVQHDSIFSGHDGHELMAPGAPYVSREAHLRESPILTVEPAFKNWLQNHIREAIPEGTILSGSEFVGTASRKLDLASTHLKALAVEMESAGVALVAKRLSVPVGVVKTIADRLNPDHSVSVDYNRFVEHAADNAAELVENIFESFSVAPSTYDTIV